MTGCQDNLFQNGDLDFDGTPYWTEWPTSLTPNTYPSSFLESFPTSNGSQYSQFFIQTDVALSESTCGGQHRRRYRHLGGCTVPPPGPGGFYPYWSQVQSGGSCSLLFGNVLRRVHLRQGRAVRDEPVQHVRLPAVHRPDAQQPLPVPSAG